MKFLHAIAIAGLAGTIAVPAFAAAHAPDPMTMTCADYTAMDDAGKMAAVESLGMAAMADEAMKEKMSTEAMTPEQNMQMVMTACEGKPEMMAIDGMMMPE